jgi:hypothetical protein
LEQVAAAVVVEQAAALPANRNPIHHKLET